MLYYWKNRLILYEIAEIWISSRYDARPATDLRLCGRYGQYQPGGRSAAFVAAGRVRAVAPAARLVRRAFVPPQRPRGGADGGWRTPGRAGAPAAPGDRKSTRLNSSH